MNKRYFVKKDFKIKKEKILVDQYANENVEEVDEKYLKNTAPLIGNIVHRFNSREALLDSYICEYFIDDNDLLGLQVIYKRKYSEKVDLFKRLYEEAQRELNKKMPTFSKLVKRLEESGKLRNMVVHTKWENINSKKYTMSKLKINKNGAMYEYVQFTINSLEKILKYINNTYDMFDKFAEEREELFY